MTKRTATVSILVALLIVGGIVAAVAASRDLAANASQEIGQELARRHAAEVVGTLQLARSDHYLHTILYTGQLRAVREIAGSFDRGGRIVEVAVEQGATVRKGQVLARLDARKLESMRDELLAQQAAARASLEELRNGPRAETIAVARAEVRQRRAVHQMHHADLVRHQKLIADKAVADREYEQALFAEDAAQAELDAAETRLKELLAGTRTERVQAQEANVRQLSASLAHVRVQLDDCVLKAPFDAVIVERLLDEGEVVSPGAAVVRLTEDRPCEAWIGMPADSAALWKTGDEAQVTVNGEAISASVSAVLPEVDRITRTQPVVFQLHRKARRLAPGMLSRVSAVQRVEAPGFWTPVSALTHGRRGLWAIAIAAPDKESDLSRVATRDVEVLHQENGRAFIRGAISEGELAIVEGGHRVVDGQWVRTAPADLDGEAP